MLTKEREIKCNDGSKRYVIENLNEITEYIGDIFKERKIQIGFGIRVATSIIDANANADLGNQASVIPSIYDKILSRAKSKYKAAYLMYKTNPCEKDKFLEDEYRSINLELDKLTKVEMELKDLKDLPAPSPMEAGGTDPRLPKLQAIRRKLNEIENAL